MLGSVERDRFTLGIGGTFHIGQTVFTLRASEDTRLADKAEQAEPNREPIPRTREDLVGSAFHEQSLLAKLYPLMVQLGSAPSQSVLFTQLVDKVLESLPWVAAAAVVETQTNASGEFELKVRASETRRKREAGTFVPSRTLVKYATSGAPKSSRYKWADPGVRAPQSGEATMYGRQAGTIPWAVCTPFHDGSRYALYLAGFAAVERPETVADILASGPKNAPGAGLLPRIDTNPLDDAQRFAELAVQVAEKERAKLPFKEQRDLALRAWPSPLRTRVLEGEQFSALLREPKVTDITVLFCDLRGYSQFAEQYGDDLRAAFAVVQKALDVMCTEVTSNDGIVAGFRGDAILGFWGWPEGADDQIKSAARAAQRIYERLAEMGRQCGLGVTHGPALVGRLGAYDLAQVDLYGPVVNLAFRLEEMTKHFGVGIVVSDTVAAHLRAVDPTGRRFRPRDLGTVKPRGVKNTLPVSELAPTVELESYRSWLTQPDHMSRTQSWNAALKLFSEGMWTMARDRFVAFPGDPVAAYLLKWMHQRNFTPPPTWDGTYEPVVLPS
jgi:class 3 adenylate cyclase